MISILISSIKVVSNLSKVNSRTIVINTVPVFYVYLKFVVIGPLHRPTVRRCRDSDEVSVEYLSPGFCGDRKFSVLIPL